MASLKGNKKVAKNRGKNWRKKLVCGKKEAKLKPSNLYLVRAKTGLSQSDIATGLGVSLATYGAIERGRRTVKIVLMKEIADKFSMKYCDLFNLEKNGKGLAIIHN